MSRQIYLNGQQKTHLIAQGQVDIFAFKKDQNGSAGRLHHFITLKDGQSFQDFERIHDWDCVAKLQQGTRLKACPELPEGGTAQADYAAYIEKLEAKLGREAQHLRDRALKTDVRVTGAINKLANVNDQLSKLDSHDFNNDDCLRAVCDVIGEYVGVEIKYPTYDIKVSSLTAPEQVFVLSQIRYRKVYLSGKWWRRISGPLVGELNDGTPVALLPRGLNGYTIYNPKTSEHLPLNEARAAELSERAFSLYRTFPRKPLGIPGLLKFLIGNHIYVEAAIIFGCSLFASIAQVLPPIISKQVFDEIVPGNMRGMLVEVVLILIAFQTAQIGFQVITNLGFSRIKTKIDISLQGAVWDRLLAQKMQFFYRYTTGELLEKIGGINQLSTSLSLDLLKSIMATLFSFINLIVMYNYSPAVTRQLGWPFGIMFAVMFLLSYQKYKLSAKLISATNKASSMNHQLVTGIQRIKTSHAEDRAFERWSDFEADRRYLQGRLSLYQTVQDAFKALFGILSVAYVYLLISRATSTSMGVFVAYLSTFLIFQAAMVQLATIVDTLVMLAPIVNNVKPIMKSVPEESTRRTTPKDMDGSLDLSHVSFDYEEYGRTILHDISFRIEKDESVGIVGLSGCGKSTLIRLILGLYEPTAGKVYFGGYDLQSIDTQFLRRQLGVVMQAGELAFGTIYSNITQNDITVTEDDVIEALKTVVLYDDIMKLPNGIHTAIDTENVSLSEGQIQRLLIARAIVKEREYLFFDEATSRLDNITARQIAGSIMKRKGTKLIIAQRLATVEECDRIIVMDEGKILADGSYDEIIKQKHMFGVVFDLEDMETAEYEEE